MGSSLASWCWVLETSVRLITRQKADGVRHFLPCSVVRSTFITVIRELTLTALSLF